MIDECNDFPAGRHDDYVDTVSMTMLRFRQGGLIGTTHDQRDEEDEDDKPPPTQRYGYHLR